MSPFFGREPVFGSWWLWGVLVVGGWPRRLPDDAPGRRSNRRQLRLILEPRRDATIYRRLQGAALAPAGSRWLRTASLRGLVAGGGTLSRRSRASLERRRAGGSPGEADVLSAGPGTGR